MTSSHPVQISVDVVAHEGGEPGDVIVADVEAVRGAFWSSPTTGGDTEQGDGVAVDGYTSGEDDGDVESVLSDIKAHPGDGSPNSLLGEISKLGQVHAVGADQGVHRLRT